MSETSERPASIASIAQRHVTTDPARTYIDNAAAVLVELRKRIVDLDADWQRRRREIIRRNAEELAAIDAQHSHQRQRFDRLALRLAELTEE